MPLKSNFILEKCGFVTFPANKTFLHLLSFRILIIFPNCPIETECDLLSDLKFFF